MTDKILVGLVSLEKPGVQTSRWMFADGDVLTITNLDNLNFLLAVAEKAGSEVERLTPEQTAAVLRSWIS